MGATATSAIKGVPKLKEYLQVKGLNLIVSTIFLIFCYIYWYYW